MTQLRLMKFLRHFRAQVAPLLWVLLSLFMLAAPGTSMAVGPVITATKDDGVASGATKQTGDTVNYVIQINNAAGAALATGVTLTDPTPTHTTLVAGSLHASPLAIDDTYNAVGNTTLYVGVTPPVGEPAAYVAGSLFDNDVTILDATVLASNTNPAHGTVVVNTDGTFTYTPTAGYSGADSFTYTVKNSVDATLTDTATVSITVSNPVWYVNNSGLNGNGTSTSPFNSVAGVNSSSAANQLIYVYKGGGAYNGALTLKNGQTLTSENVALATGGYTLRAAVPGNVPTLSNSGGSTVVLASGNTITDFIITNSAGNGISGSAIGTAAISNIALTVTGGTALNATTSGTLTVTGAANTLASTNGAALNVQNVTIGAGGLTLRSVSSSNAVNGLVLVNTGSTAGLTITGNGGGCSSAGSCTGGAIQNSTGSGVVLTSTKSPSLTRLYVGDSAGTGADDGVAMTNVSGTVTIDNSFILNSPHNGITVFNTNTNLAGFSLTNTTVACVAGNPCEPGGSIGNDGVLIQMTGTSVLTSGLVSDSTFNGHRAVGLQVQTADSASVGSNNGSGGIVNSFTVQNNTFAGSGQGVDIDSSQVSSLTFQVLNNTVNGIAGGGSATALNAFTTAGTDTGSSHTFVGKIDSNLVGTQGTKDSGSGFGSGIRAVVQGQATAGVVTITSNTIRETANADIITAIGQNGAGGSPSASARFKITGNNMPAPSGSNLALCGSPNTPCASNGVFVQADEGSAVGTVITGNSIYDVSSANGIYDVYLAERAGPPVGSQLTVETTGATPSAYIQAQNTLAGPQAFLDEGGNVSNVAIGSTGIYPLMFAPGGVESAMSRAVQTPVSAGYVSASLASLVSRSNRKTEAASDALSQSQLDAVVAQARALWEATGLTGEQVARLHSLRFELATLTDLHLGEASGNDIRVDRNAGGKGWFVEHSERDGAVFAKFASATRSYSDSAGAAAGRVDLLTAVLHEMGHAIGLEDSYLEADRDNVMYGYLTQGERRVPAAAQAAGVRIGQQAAMHFLSAPLTIGTLPPGKSVTVKYQVTIDDYVASVTNQGTISGNFTSVLTQDPNGGGPTVTSIYNPPTQMSANAATTPQTATIGTAFANALAVTVLDAGNNPVPSVSVTFTAPGSGASGIFTNSTSTITVATNASGVASAVFAANLTAGGPFNVTASATGPASVNFSLTNILPVPAVTAIAPTSGPVAGGTSVTITGTDLTGVTGVTIGGTAATGVTLINATTVTAITPAHAAGTASVVVTTPGGANAANTLFSYLAAPTVSAISPATGSTAGGTSVTITGTNLTGATSVTIGGTAASAVTVGGGGTSITATTPAHSAGTASVVVTTPGGTNAANSLYTYIDPPTVSAISPTSGPMAGGTSVTITGTNLTGATGVTIGGAAATGATVGGGGTTITAITPAGLAGTASVVVTAPGGTNAANTLYSYIPENIMVYRVGDGATALTAAGSAVFLDEYTPSSGTLVQTIAAPTAPNGANRSLVASGTIAAEGLMTRSVDGSYVLLTGYDAAIATPVVSTTASATINRVIGRLDRTGTMNTTTALSDVADGSSPRGVTSTNGVDLWVSGGAGGVRYTTLGSSTSTQISTTLSDARGMAIYDGQLYTSTQSGVTIRVGTVGAGVPTTGGQTITNLPGFSTTSTPNSFLLADLDAGVAGVDTLYVADEAAGGILKYALVGGVWTSVGTITATTVYGLTGTVTGSNVTLYVSYANGTKLAKVVDTAGYNVAPSMTTVTDFATAAANTVFRGVALAPNASSPIITSVTPNAAQVGQSNISVAIAGQFTNWVQGISTVSFGSGITVNTLTVNSATSATADISVQPAASTGARNVTVTTAAQVITLASSFMVNVGAPTQMSTNAGTTPQSTAISTAFANALAVTVMDSGNNPVSGVNVTFTAPGSGASGLFSNSTTTIVVATNASGVASAPFTANSTAGASYNVSAAAAGLASVTFVLTNTAGAAATMTANAGTTPQSTAISTAFANALAVTVRDGGNNPVSGVNVTFTAPGSGASGLFSNSTATIVVATNTSGIASAPFTANATIGGAYSVTAAATGLTSINFALTNTAGVPFAMTANAGTTPQSTSISTAFANALAVTVKDASNNPVSGVNVTFSAPGSGASGLFSNSTTTIVVATNASGVASAPFTANSTAGASYNVSAAAAGLTSVTFALTNTAGAAATMTANAGTTPQSTAIITAFANALAVTVRDGGNNPVSGVNVTFTAPGSGASGLFSNSTATIVVATNTSGIASAPFTANATTGGPYTVTAAATGLGSLNFLLTNTVPLPTVTAIVPSAGPTTGGTSVTITGTNLTGATSVTIGGTAATSVTVVNATTITAITPAGVAGAASVVVTTPLGSNTANTLYTYTIRSITGASPTGTGSITAAFTGGGASCSFVNAQFIPLVGHPSSPPTGSAPSGVAFAHGLFDFSTSGCTPGSTITVTITYPSALPTGTQYWKYGPTAAPGWHVFPSTVAGNTISFAITDGGAGDADQLQNGSMVDPGGAGAPAALTGIPTLNTWGMLLTLMLMLAVGGVHCRQTRQTDVPLQQQAKKMLP